MSISKEGFAAAMKFVECKRVERCAHTTCGQCKLNAVEVLAVAERDLAEYETRFKGMDESVAFMWESIRRIANNAGLLTAPVLFEDSDGRRSFINVLVKMIKYKVENPNQLISRADPALVSPRVADKSDQFEKLSPEMLERNELINKIVVLMDERKERLLDYSLLGSEYKELCTDNVSLRKRIDGLEKQIKTISAERDVLKGKFDKSVAATGVINTARLKGLNETRSLRAKVGHLEEKVKRLEEGTGEQDGY